MKNYGTGFLCMLLLAMKMLTLSSCANILPPQGGLRDSLPPRLVSAVPKDSSVNVRPKTITLVFDEYIQLQNAYSNLVISPIPSVTAPPQVDAKLRTITIRIKDSLESNTTYSFNFGNALQDVNESNIAKDFTYAFSTGPKIDLNTYSGKVMVAETGKPADSTGLIVILHRNLQDTAVKTGDPRYYATLNGKGEFRFANLPEGDFNVFAVSNRLSKRYTDSTELFAFRSRPVHIGGDTPPDTLYAFDEVKKKAAGTGTPRAAAPTARNQDRRLRYQPELENGTQDILSPLSLNFSRKLFAFDSTKIGLYDTSYHLLKGTAVHLDSARTRVTVQYKWKDNSSYRLLIAKDAVADSMGVVLSKEDTLQVNTRKESDYGSIRIRFENLDLTRNPVLQIVQGDKVVDSAALTIPNFERKLFRPGSYEMRILYDANQNGKWDTGSYPDKRQPETVFLIKQQLTIRANWDNMVNVIL